MDISIRCIDSADIDAIARLANNFEIAKMTANLPHPYEAAHAKVFLDHVEATENEHVFAICADGQFMGVVGLVHEPDHNRAELGYWLGQPYWCNGYTSTAAGMVIAYAFSVLDVHKVYSYCFSGNTASIRVLEKNGFVLEGCQKDHFVRLGKTHDILCYGLLKQNYHTKDI